VEQVSEVGEVEPRSLPRSCGQRSSSQTPLGILRCRQSTTIPGVDDLEASHESQHSNVGRDPRRGPRRTLRPRALREPTHRARELAILARALALAEGDAPLANAGDGRVPVPAEAEVSAVDPLEGRGSDNVRTLQAIALDDLRTTRDRVLVVGAGSYAASVALELFDANELYLMSREPGLGRLDRERRLLLVELDAGGELPLLPGDRTLHMAATISGHCEVSFQAGEDRSARFDHAFRRTERTLRMTPRHDSPHRKCAR